MPEGPEVRSITDKLSERMTGMVLIGLGWDQSSKYSEGLPRYDHMSSILPMTIADVTCKGKQIFFHLVKEYLVDGKEYTHRIYLNSTLGMEGKWMWGPGNHSNFWLTLGTRKSSAIDLIVKSQIVYFDDSRHFGNLTLMTEHEYHEKLGKIGPDLLT